MSRELNSQSETLALSDRVSQRKKHALCSGVWIGIALWSHMANAWEGLLCVCICMCVCTCVRVCMFRHKRVHAFSMYVCVCTYITESSPVSLCMDQYS